MRGCRHSGVRVIVPPRKAERPMRITCRYLRRDRLLNPPPLMEGEALASRILEFGPVGAKFLGPVIIEVPHFASLRGKERELVILRSDNGSSWREHTLEASEEAVQDVLNESFEGEELRQLEDLHTSRITRILTVDFPQYFAIVSRLRQEVHAVGPEGGVVSSTAVPQVQALFPPGALTKKIRVGLQAQPIPSELVSKLFGNRVAISPIVTVEPRRRKFHKPINLTIPLPQAANKGMINQYSGDAPTLRLLCSITGGSSKAQWEDVTGSTPLTLVKDCVSFTTTVSARFWLIDCRNISQATNMATDLYKEASHVPFMAKFVVFAKRIDSQEARLRVFCMTDDKEDKTLEHQEHFTEVAKSRDIEVLEGKPLYLEFIGNLVPISKTGDQLVLNFKAFHENRLPFTARVRDLEEPALGRILFMREPKVIRGEPSQLPLGTLNIALPDNIIHETSCVSESDFSHLDKSCSFLKDICYDSVETIHRADIRLSDISNLLGEDWVLLAQELGVTDIDVQLIESEYPSSVQQQAIVMLKLWIKIAGNRATGNNLEKGLRNIGRQDIVVQCIKNVEVVTDDLEVAVAKVQLDQSGFDTLRDELSPSLDNSIKQDTSAEYDYPVCKSNSNVSVEHNLGGSIDNENNVAVKINNANNQMTKVDHNELESCKSKKEDKPHVNADIIDCGDGEECKYKAEEKKITHDFIHNESVVQQKSRIPEVIAKDNLKKSEWNSKNNGDNSLDSENALCRSDSLDAEMIVKEVPHESGWTQQRQMTVSSDSDSEGHSIKNNTTKKSGLKTLGSSSGSDVAVHEGADDSSDAEQTASDLTHEHLSHANNDDDIHRTIASS